MIKFIKENSYHIFKMLLSQVAIAIFALVMVTATAANEMLFMASGVFSILFYLYLLYLMSRGIGEKDCPAVTAGRRKPTPFKGVLIALCANSINIICGLMVFVFSFFLVSHVSVSVVNEQGEPVSFKYKYTDSSGEEKFSDLRTELYTESGGQLYSYDNGMKRISVKALNNAGDTQQLYDEAGEELTIYGSNSRDLYANIEHGYSENWASDLYGIPCAVCIFFQSMFTAVRSTFFPDAQWFYLVTPLLSLAACGLGYYLASRGKRILFFLPESKTPRRYRP